MVFVPDGGKEWYCRRASTVINWHPASESAMDRTILLIVNVSPVDSGPWLWVRDAHYFPDPSSTGSFWSLVVERQSPARRPQGA